MDEADLGNEAAERELTAILAAKRPDPLPATGECYFCGEPLRPGFRFCGTDCRDGYDAEQASRTRNGHNQPAS